MKKILRGCGIAISVPIVLLVLLSVLFYFPPFQNWAVRQVAEYASEETGMNISVDKVHLVFPLDLGVEGVRVTRPIENNLSDVDTIADIRKVVANIQLLPLLQSRVEIDKLSFNDMKLNTTDFIAQAIVKGNIGTLSLKAHGIDLGAETMNLDEALLDKANVDIALTDSVPEDTTESENFWKINVGKLAIKQTDIALTTPGDTMSVGVGIKKANIENGFFDLYKAIYKVGLVDWRGGYIAYDQNFEPKAKGLDVNHIRLDNMALSIKDIVYCSPNLDMNIRACAFKEKSGIEVSNITGAIGMDSTKLKLPLITLKTPYSEASAKLTMDINAFDDENPGALHVKLHGALGKKDLMTFMADMPTAFKRQWPYNPLAIDAIVHGNMRKMEIDNLAIELPSAMKLKASGQAWNINDMDHLKAHANIEAKTYNLKFATTLLDKSVAKMINIPSGIALKGKVDVDGKKYATAFNISEGKGSVGGKASINLANNSYKANIKARSLQLQHFTRGLGLSPLTGEVAVAGKGFDMMSPKTKLEADINLSQFSYQGYNLDGIKGNALVNNGKIAADIVSDNKVINGNIALNALTNGKEITASLACQLHELDLFKMRLVESPLKISMSTQLDVSSNLTNDHRAQGTIRNILIQDKDGEYTPEDIDLDILALRDTTHAIVNTGDFHLNMDASGGYEMLMDKLMSVSDEVMKQMKDRYIDQSRLRERLPNARISFSSGSNNIFARLLKHYGMECKSIDMDMASSPIAGLNGYANVNSITVGGILIDATKFSVKSDKTDVKYSIQVKNNKNNPDYVFNAIVNGTITERGTTIESKLYDWKNRLGLSANMAANMEENGIKISFVGDDPVLGYKKFGVNNDNYIFLAEDNRVSANLKMKASDGTGLQIYTNDANEDALQDITLSVNKLNLDDIFALLPFTPNMTGVLDGDFHAIQTKDELSLSSTLQVANMIYEGCKMGTVGTEFTYMPKYDGSHYVDGVLMQNGEEVCTLTGTYISEGDGHLDASLGLDHTPLSLVNGFIPEQLFGLKGYGEGGLTIKGSLTKPEVNGEVYLDSAYLYSVPYGVELRFDNDPVTITNSRLLFENFEMYSHNDKPLVAAGYVDFSDLDNMYADIKMKAENFLLIDSKENLRSEAYGKAYVNFYARMQGAIDNLQMRGKLDVLGSTDMTYVLKDSPITTDNQLEDLVKFTNFADSTTMDIERPPLNGFSMDMNISINESAHILCALNANKSNYVDLIGGGDLRMKYNTIDELSLRGRYTLNNGEMKYSLPVIPLKTFVIQDGSYVEFTGDPMNPRLNITALEDTKATVSDANGNNRSVDFKCGVIITKTLEDMGLEFVIYAPQDMSLSNELNTMSTEERGKIAITMLTTGMYLADGNTNSFSMNSALNSFLQSQINGIAGNALRTLDLSFGLDNTTDATGNVRTDYSFKFAKRFWNNRLKIIVGGKLSTGSDVANQNETFFNNVQFEYRLNEASTQYLNVFYNRDSYDWLEGNIGEYGGGFIWRRKLQNFKDIFRFKDVKTPIIMSTDSTKSTQK